MIFETLKNNADPFYPYFFLSIQILVKLRKKCFEIFQFIMGFNRKTCFQSYNSLNKTFFSRFDFFSFVIVFQSYYTIEESDSKLESGLRIEFE